MRDVNYGWLLRYMHANGASFFFIAVYIHIFRGLYYGSYKAPREVLWILGVLILRADDGHGLPRLRAAVGPDVVLGRHGDHQSVQRVDQVDSVIVGTSAYDRHWLWGGFGVERSRR